MSRGGIGPAFPLQPDPLRLWSRLIHERLALADRMTGARLTYAELNELSDRWTVLLRALGVGPGDRAAALCGNRVELIALFFACGRVGAALVPLNWRLAAAELGPILADAAPQALFGESRFRTLAERATAAMHARDVPRWIDFDAEAPALLRRAGPVGADAVAAADDPLLVLYTSGSTGRPKGAVLPRRQIFYNAVATAAAWEIGPGDVAPIATPCFHTGGWNVFATPLWYRGGSVALFDAFEPDDFLAGLAEERCTFALTVPTQLLMLLESRAWGTPLPALRSFFSGGAPLPATVAARVRAAGYPLREGYGLTECGPNCFALPAALAPERPGVVGWPVPFLDARLVDDTGTDVPPGTPGELWLRGPQLFGGYLGDPLRTADALAPGGWLRTGDLALQESDGAFRICGRRKDMFISGGENVYPAEVEAALADCPGVQEVVVIGVPDERWGEVGRAFVVPATGAALDDAAILAHVRSRLASYKTPRSVVILQSMPRLGSGKPDRRALAQLALPQLA